MKQARVGPSVRWFISPQGYVVNSDNFPQKKLKSWATEERLSNNSSDPALGPPQREWMNPSFPEVASVTLLWFVPCHLPHYLLILPTSDLPPLFPLLRFYCSPKASHSLPSPRSLCSHPSSQWLCLSSNTHAPGHQPSCGWLLLSCFFQELDSALCSQKQ